MLLWSAPTYDFFTWHLVLPGYALLHLSHMDKANVFYASLGCQEQFQVPPVLKINPLRNFN